MPAQTKPEPDVVKVDLGNGTSSTNSGPLVTEEVTPNTNTPTPLDSAANPTHLPPMTDSMPPPPTGGFVAPPSPSSTPVSSAKKEDGPKENDIPDLPPVLSTSGKPKKSFPKRTVATILGILLLVGAVGAGVTLVQQNQDIREKAVCTANNACLSPGDSCCGLEIFDASCAVTEARCSQSPSLGECESPGSCGASAQSCGPGEKCFKPAVGDSYCQADSSCGGDGGGDGDECTPGGSDCAFRERCDDGTCIDIDFCDNNSCDVETAYPGCSVSHYMSNDKDDPTVLDIVIAQGVRSANLGATDCGAEQIDVSCDGDGLTDGVWRRYDTNCTGGGGGNDNDTPTPTTPPSEGGQCLDVKILDSNFEKLGPQKRAALVPGQLIYLAVSGERIPGGIDRARFWINEVRQDPTTRNRSIEDKRHFFMQYVIPAGTTSMKVDAQVHSAGENKWY